MISCDQDILSLYLDDALTLPQRYHLESHLRACDDCSRELETLRRMDLVLGAWGEVRTPVPVESNRRLMRSVERRRRLGPLASFGRMVPAAFGTGIAALLVLVSVNAGIIGLSQNTPSTPGLTGPTVPSRVLIKQSARLINARRSSAILDSYHVRVVQPQMRRINLEVN